MKKRSIVCLCLCGCLLLGCGVGCQKTAQPQTPPFDKLTVSFLPVGKADAVLVKAPEGTVLIDTGLAGTASTVTAALAENGVKDLDLLILTHTGEEHIGGAAAVLDAVSVKRIIAPRQTVNSKAFAAYTAACKKHDILPEKPTKTETVTLGNAVLTVLPAAKETYKKANDGSLITELTYGANRMVFASDAGRERTAEYLNSSPTPCDLLKLPDHGEWVANTAELMDTLAPKNSILTCGEQSLPVSTVAIDLSQKYGKLFFTYAGTVCAETDGVTLTVTQSDNR